MGNRKEVNAAPTVYGVGIETAPDEFGMVDGPTPDLARLLDTRGDDYDNPDGRPVYIVRLDPGPAPLYYWSAATTAGWVESSRQEDLR